MSQQSRDRHVLMHITEQRALQVALWLVSGKQRLVSYQVENKRAHNQFIVDPKNIVKYQNNLF